MPHFRVVSKDSLERPRGTMAFDAQNFSIALALIAEQYPTRPFELWCDGRLVGRLTQISEGRSTFWRLG